jgi:hypothetical protein
MNWTEPPATENTPGPAGLAGREPYPPSTTSPQLPSGAPAQTKAPELKIGKSLMLAAKPGEPNREVFTLTLGGETIELLPFKNWIQLDHFKWTVRGKLPAEPAGLEIFSDHLRLMGETVALNDPEGCLKLERHFNEWLSFERETLELARKKLKAHAAAPEPDTKTEPQALRFRVEMDKRGQVHIYAEQGRNILASVGLTLAGLKSLCQQGLMRKPQRIEIGALHDWVELDGELCSFDKGRNDTTRLEQLLNERFIPAGSFGGAKEVLVFLNAASSSGFDIQFPVKLAGVADNHRYHLNDASLELLTDPEHCGLLHKEIIVKLIPPNLVFKQKTPDGGEQYLAWGAETAVPVIDEDGHEKTIQLSQPLNLLRLSPAELTAVFNHPCINRHTQAAPPVARAAQPPSVPPAREPTALPELQPQAPPAAAKPPLEKSTLTSESAETIPASASKEGLVAPVAKISTGPVILQNSRPNAWLKEILAQPVLPHDWFACLTYSKVAEKFGKSSEGKFGAGKCWFISLGATEDIEDPQFKGIVLTEKGSLGFLNEGQMARFYNGVAFIGARQAALEAIQVNLVAVGLDAHVRVVFIVNDDYREKFDVPQTTLTEVLTQLSEFGAVVMSVSEAIADQIPLEVVWTAPVTQPEPDEPQALEHTRQAAAQ